MNRASAIAAVAAAGPVRRVKVRAQQQPAAAVVASAEVDWRVKPRRDQAAAATSSRRGRSEATPTEAATAVERSPAKRSNSSRSGGEAQSSSGGGGGGGGGGGSKSGNAGSMTDSTSSPCKKPASATTAATAEAAADTAEAAAPKNTTDDEKGERKGQGDKEEEEEKLPPCPYPGHQNVSWTCHGCGGAKHHLTSRSAMEPLQRVHGFKVQRVPNDGDCFFSSIKAALPDGAAAGTEAAKAGRALTVAEMREWVAEEAGQEQLEFYILQAVAHPEDRWLDFVRPLHERIPSDDEEEDNDDDGSYKDDAESAASLSQSQSQSQGSRSKSRTSPRQSASGSRPSRAARARGRKKEDNGTSEGRGGEGGKGRGKGGKRGGGGGHKDAGVAATCAGGGDGDDDTVDVLVTALSASSASDRYARRLRRSRNGGRGPSAVADSPAAATNTWNNERNAKPAPSQPSTAVAAAVVSPSRKSARLGRGLETGDWRVCADSGGKREGTGEAEIGEKGNKGKEDQDEGLPFVQTVEDLRRFLRREGSVVGHGNCMWADTFAHHVVSRRLKITILFVDMEREKSAWPYRVLARTMTDSDDEDDERFVILKREPSHFVLLKTAPSPDEKSREGTGSGGSCGEATAAKQRGNQACFSRCDLPDVVRRLWQIEPRVKAPASRSAGDYGRRA
eukprot:g12757.t1